MTIGLQRGAARLALAAPRWRVPCRSQAEPVCRVPSESIWEPRLQLGAEGASAVKMADLSHGSVSF